MLLVWLLQIGEPLPLDSTVRKLRTGMLADALAERGHEVVWWTSSFMHLQKKMLFGDDEELPLHPQIRIRTLKGIGYSRNVSPRRYADHWMISKKFKARAADARPPNVIVAFMPDYHLAYEGVSFAHRHRIPVLVDIRDQWPDSFLKVVPAWVRPFLRTVLFRDYQKLSAVFRDADGITSATTTWLEWGLAKAARQRTSNDRVFYLGAKKFRREICSRVSDRISQIVLRAEGRFVVTFVGTFSHVHAPRIVAKAAKLFKTLMKPADLPIFILAGDGPFHREVREDSEGLENVILPGWLNNHEIAAVLSISSVGIVPFCLSTDQFPNKAFTYLSAGLPVLASDTGDLSRLLLEYEAGFHFEYDAPHEFSEHILRLMSDNRLYEEMGLNAFRLFEEQFRL